MSSVSVNSNTVSLATRLRQMVRRAFASYPFASCVAAAMVAMMGIALVGLVVDHQIITGVPAFEKPLKFALAIFIYIGTVLYLLTFVQGHRRLVRVIVNVSAFALVVEMALIALQVVRGTTSHFNFATPFDATVYQGMGVLIVVTWMMGLVLAVLLLRQRLPDPAWAWALRAGMLLALVGMAVAVLMLSPTAQQLSSLQAGGKLTTMGAHTVGIPDGGPGLPFLGWSTVAGDLRVPHFFGLHGLQGMLVLGALVTTLGGRFDARHQTALVLTSGAAYLGFVFLLTWQALRAQSLVRPDALTLAVLGALVVATLAAVLGIVRHGQNTQSPAN